MKRFFAALLRHPLSMAGTVVVTVSAAVFLIFFALDFGAGHDNPYSGIVGFLVVPALFVVGLVLIPIGLSLERRRRAKRLRAGELPVLDFNQPAARSGVVTFLLLTIANVALVGLAAYKGVETMDTQSFCGQACHSVMQPEFTAYQRGAHASVACVDCHIGPGADWFVKSKLSGAWQVVSVNLDLYPRPIPTPIENLRPARETCEQCHWPSKFVGDRLKVITTYSDDEANAELKTVLLLRVGGIQGRQSHGIHWHVDPANAIRYRSDATRETIYEVEMRNGDGSLERYFAPGADAGELAAAGVWRTMDCVDCHNRPSHTFHTAEDEVDAAIATGRMARDLPFVRREGVRLIRGEYASHEAARAAIAEGLTTFYAGQYPQLAGERQAAIAEAAEALWEAYRANVFPSMKVTWGTYPNHIGHEKTPGCYRCHDEEHRSASGKAISQDCSTCHSLLAMQEADPEILRTLNP